jgi:hypothetical protein
MEVIMDTMQIKLMVDNYLKKKEQVREMFINRGIPVPKSAELLVEDKQVKFVWTKGCVTKQVSMTIDEVEMTDAEYYQYKGK